MFQFLILSMQFATGAKQTVDIDVSQLKPLDTISIQVGFG